MKKNNYSILCLLPVLLLFMTSTSLAEEGPLELITVAEAASPDMPPSEWYTAVSSTDNNGPVIELISPQIGLPQESPVSINIQFVEKEGRDVDLSTFKVEYLKFITIDLTPRLKQYVTKEGVHAEKTNLPSGKHTIRLSIGDTSGAITKRIFTIKVL